MNFFLTFIALLFFISSAPVLASNYNFGVSVEVTGCNNNGSCEAGFGENTSNCPNDCVLNNNVNTGGGGAGSGNMILTTPESETEKKISSTTKKDSEILPAVSPLFYATSGDGQVILYWIKPVGEEWLKIIIRRSILFYPDSVESGGLLYEGDGESSDGIKFSLKDTKVVNGKRYYYTIFVFDKSGQISSGSGVTALPQSKKITQPALEIPKEELPAEFGLPKSSQADTQVLFSDLVFVDSRQSVSAINNEVKISEKDNIIIKLPLQKLPAGTKTVIFTLKNSAGYRSYFLNRNDILGLVDTAFSGLESGRYEATVTFLDKNHQILSKIKGNVEFISSLITSSISPSWLDTTKANIKKIVISYFNQFYSWILQKIYLFFSFLKR